MNSREPDAPTLEWTDTVRRRLDDEWAVTLRVIRHGGRARSAADDRAESVITRYHPVTDGQVRVGGAVWVGGAGGGLDGPARGLYPAACRRLQELGVAGLRLHYRRPNHLEECVLDTLLGVEFLANEGVERIGVIGHSFGGAVVITAGALSERVRAVVPMSTQTYGTQLAAQVSPRPMLLIHGTVDEILPDACSRQVYANAREPKELKLYRGAGHGLDEAREEILDLLVDWIPRQLRD